MDVDSLFDLLFGNSAFLADFHKNRKTVGETLFVSGVISRSTYVRTYSDNMRKVC
jgi:hypothetical protein